MGTLRMFCAISGWPVLGICIALPLPLDLVSSDYQLLRWELSIVPDLECCNAGGPWDRGKGGCQQKYAAQCGLEALMWTHSFFHFSFFPL